MTMCTPQNKGILLLILLLNVYSVAVYEYNAWKAKKITNEKGTSQKESTGK